MKCEGLFAIQDYEHFEYICVYIYTYNLSIQNILKYHFHSAIFQIIIFVYHFNQQKFNAERTETYCFL